ncbi:unnamed protein product [Dovyalis caffra]|uniref:Uncharacterized protein n=1 Tax=Dovyalis caffra TaxID=77055 RepID=A0AAV1S066_9ROSI|nr:unnamed protein product [Dovyalis caffra]
MSCWMKNVPKVAKVSVIKKLMQLVQDKKKRSAWQCGLECCGLDGNQDMGVVVITNVVSSRPWSVAPIGSKGWTPLITVKDAGKRSKIPKEKPFA